MTEHLSSSTLAALADGELSVEELALAKEHLDSCTLCTSNALAQSMIKTATRKAGRRYIPTDEFKNRIKVLIAQNSDQPLQADPRKQQSFSGHRSWAAFSGWATAAALVLIFGGWQIQHRIDARRETSRSQQASLAAEASDLHIATLAANQPPEVLSSDRHTVKPWFQGKIPFAFNLPQSLPDDTKLIGANLTYLGRQPIAQLIYSIGQHRVSVFVRQRASASEANQLPAQNSGFQIVGFCGADVCAIAVSDVDRARLVGLVSAIQQAQNAAPMQ
jgi:anti-sigma factor RsiW